ncbi:MAG: PHP domain-containing protein [Actinomycetaceae bacterium]|nr:PHP domain-containing protein [Actinomycetaceae bacterium]
MHSPANVLIANKCIEAYNRCRNIGGVDGLIEFFKEINTGNSRVSADVFLSQGQIAGVRYTLNDGALAPVTCTGSKIKFSTDDDASNFGAGKGSIFIETGWLKAFNAHRDLPLLEQCAAVHELSQRRNVHHEQSQERLHPAPAHRDSTSQTTTHTVAAPRQASPATARVPQKACLYSNSIYTPYGLLSPEEIAEKAKAQGFSHAALTDVATLTGVPRFVRACKEQNITPLVGVDLAVRGIPGTPDDRDTRMALIVKDEVGWRNACVLLTAANLNKNLTSSDKSIAMNAAAWVSWQDLRNLSGGLLAFSRGDAGPLQQSEDITLTRAALVDAFGKNNIYADTVVDGVQLAGGAVIQTNTTQNSELADARWQFFKHMLSEIKDIDGAIAQRIVDGVESVRISKAPSSVDDLEIARRCKPLDDLWVLTPPKLALPQEQTAHSILKDMVQEGLRMRLEQAHIDKTSELARKYETRIKYELTVIDKMGFSDYFLIVYSAACESRELGAGKSGGTFVRGSAACSATLWALGASQVDPVRHKLPFERFLNDKRKTPPDVDLDTPEDTLPKLRKWLMSITLMDLQEKRNVQSNVPISGYSMLGDNGAILSAAAMLGDAELGKSVVNWCKNPIPSAPRQKLESKARSEQPRLGTKYTASPQKTLRRSPKRFFLADAKKLSRLWLLRKRAGDIASSTKRNPKDIIRLIALASLIRGAHTKIETRHPSGVVLANRYAAERFPCIATPRKDDEEPELQHALDTDGAEFFGDIKFDLLSSQELARQAKVINLINQRHKSTISHDAWNFLTDENAPDVQRALSIIGQKKLQGIFQFNKWAGAQAVETVGALLERKGKQWTFDAVAYANALARPGSDLRQGAPTLRYQEDIIGQIAAFTGMDLGSADIMRRSFEKGAVTDAQRQLFADCALSTGKSQREISTELSRLEAVSGYTFNKAHAASYALVVMRGAWLKANFPQEFTSVYASYAEDSKKASITDAPPPPMMQEQTAAIARATKPDPMPQPHQALLQHDKGEPRIALHMLAAPAGTTLYVPPILTNAPAQQRLKPEPTQARARENTEHDAQQEMSIMRQRVEVAAVIWQSAMADGRDLISDAEVERAVQDFCPNETSPDDIMPSALLIHDILAIGGVQPGWGSESLQFFFKIDNKQAEHMQLAAEAVQEHGLSIDPQDGASAIHTLEA